MDKLRSPQDLHELKERVRKSPRRRIPTLSLCDTGCRALGSGPVREALTAELKRRRLTRKFRLQRTGCHGFCQAGPLLVIRPEGILYVRVTPEDVPEIMEAALMFAPTDERVLDLLDSVMYEFEYGLRRHPESEAIQAGYQAMGPILQAALEANPENERLAEYEQFVFHYLHPNG